MTTCLEDRQKYLYGLGRQDIQQVQALLNAAPIAKEIRDGILDHLDDLRRRILVATMVRLPASGDEDAAEVIEKPNIYTDGRRVTTWSLGDNDRLIVHPPPDSRPARERHSTARF
ncbi:MAG: hypothetical protein K2X52_15965 [Mycobacteriaceae bacterium]|nr:hypothetical protein [Mycobacteriaceae bacterium]